MADTLYMYFSHPFIRYAFIVGIIVAFCASLLGVVLVLKRFSFLGDGLSHFAFGIVAVASVVGLTDNMLLVLPVTVICAVILLRAGQKAIVKADAALAVVSVSSLAIGYLLLHKFPSSSNVSGDVCSTLFGSSSLLTLNKSDVILCGVMCTLVVFVFVIFYNRIFSVTFDENFATATGTDGNVYNTVIAVTAAVIIVVAMKLVGSLLISALVVFPALSAMRVFSSFKAVVLCSSVIAVVASGTGLILSILLETPAGATMVALDLILFIVFTLVGKATKKS